MATLSGKCQLARAALAYAVSDLKKSTPAEKLISGYKSLALAGPHVFALKGISDAANFLGRVFVDQPLAVGLDQMQALAKSAATAFDRPAMSFRTVPGSFFDTKAWQAMASGVSADAEKGWTLIKTGVDPDMASSAWDLARTNFGNPTLNRIMRFTSDAIEGLTKIPHGLAYREALYRNAKLLAMHEGGTAADVTAATDRYMQIPTPEMMTNAMEIAQKAVFKNPTVLGDAAKAIKNVLAQSSDPGAQVARVALEFQAPFTSVPSAALMQGVERSPIGLVDALAKAVFGKGSPEGEALVTRVSKGMTGTAAAVGLAGALYKAGRLTGAAPDDPRQRAMWTLQGKIPNAIRIGDRWQGLGSAGPLAFPILLAANAMQERDKRASGEDATMDEVAASAGRAAWNQFTESSYLRNLQGLSEAARSNATNVQRVAAGFVPVPGVLRATEQATDPYQRQTQGVGEMVESAIPGAAQQLETRLDVLGRPIPNDRGLVGALGISKGSNVRHDMITDLATQYGVAIGYPPKTYSMDGVKQQFTDPEYRHYLQLRGQEIGEAFRVVPSLPEFQKAGPMQRQAMLKSALTEAGGYALNTFKQQKDAAH